MNGLPRIIFPFVLISSISERTKMRELPPALKEAQKQNKQISEQRDTKLVRL